MRINRDNVTPFAINVGLTVLGTIILALGTAVFIIPFDLVCGGMSGLAIVINHIFPTLPIDLIITVLTWSLFLLGLLVLGKNFALQTLISAIVYPPAISILTKLANPNFLGGVLYLKGTTHPDIAVLVAAIFGGALVGTGCSVTFLGGGSTGGMDIIAFTLCKIFKRIKSSAIIFTIDSAVIIFGLIVLKDLVVSLLGIISAFVSALVIDKIFVGGSKALIAQIVSEKSDEINRQVIERLERTTSFINITGGYSGESKKMLMVSFTMRQYNELKNIINQTDQNAFVTVHRAHEINGQGWTK